MLPHQIAEPQHAAVGVQQLVEGGIAIVSERHLVGLVLRQLGHLQLAQLDDQRLHLRLPTAVQLVPVLVVVAGPSLEEPGPLGDLGRIGHRVAGDVDVAVDDPVVDSHRRRHREHAVLPRADRLIGGVDADHVERRHREREVHRVPEPETVLVALAPALVEARVVRVHLLPALAARRRLDRERAREGAERRGACHTNLRRAVGRRGTRSGRAAALIRQPQPSGQPACISAQARLRADAQFEICVAERGGVRSKLVVTTKGKEGLRWLGSCWCMGRSPARGAGSRCCSGLRATGHTVDTLDLPGSGEDRTPVAEITLDAYAERVCEVLARGATGGAGRPQHGRHGDHAGGGAQPTADPLADLRGRVPARRRPEPARPDRVSGGRRRPGPGESRDRRGSADRDDAAPPPRAGRCSAAATTSRPRGASPSSADSRWSRSASRCRSATRPPQRSSRSGARTSPACGTGRSRRRCSGGCSRQAGCDPVIEIDTDHSLWISRTDELVAALDRLAGGG